MGLISEGKTDKKMHITDVVPFEEVFSAKRRQKKPRLNSYDYESLVDSAQTTQEKVCSKSFNVLFVFLLPHHHHPIVLLICYLYSLSMS